SRDVELHARRRRLHERQPVEGDLQAGHTGDVLVADRRHPSVGKAPSQRRGGAFAIRAGFYVPGAPGTIIPTLSAPSTIRSAPLTNDESSDARNTTASATSSMRPRRPSGRG